MPLRGGLVVAIHALAFVVDAAQDILGVGVAPVRGAAVPHCRLRQVLRHALAKGVATPEVQLGVFVSLRRRLLRPPGYDIIHHHESFGGHMYTIFMHHCGFMHHCLTVVWSFNNR